MENTGCVSDLSYEIEKWLYSGYDIESIRKVILKRQDAKKFPKNLELIDAYLDKSFESSGCAFLDTNTGETIIGFAGTNDRNGNKKFAKDVITEAQIVFTLIKLSPKYK